jgi:hypothetical protein
MPSNLIVLPESFNMQFRKIIISAVTKEFKKYDAMLAE